MTAKPITEGMNIAELQSAYNMALDASLTSLSNLIFALQEGSLTNIADLTQAMRHLYQFEAYIDALRSAYRLKVQYQVALYQEAKHTIEVLKAYKGV